MSARSWCWIFVNASRGRPGRRPLQKKKGILVELEALCQRKALNRSILIHDGSGIVESQLRGLDVDPSPVELLEADRSDAEMSTLLTLLSERCLIAWRARRGA